MSESYQTIEQGSRGATYRHDSGHFTVYEIGVYPRSSVLSGQQRRTFLDDFESLDAAKAAYPDAELINGTTYREPSLAHLPDEDDRSTFTDDGEPIFSED